MNELKGLTNYGSPWPARFHDPDKARDYLVYWSTSSLNHTQDCVFHVYFPEPANALNFPFPAVQLTSYPELASLVDALFLTYTLLDCALPSTCDAEKPWIEWSRAMNALDHLLEKHARTLDQIERQLQVDGSLILTGLAFRRVVLLALAARGYCDCGACPDGVLKLDLDDAVFAVDTVATGKCTHAGGQLRDMTKPSVLLAGGDTMHAVREHVYVTALLNRERNATHAPSPMHVRPITGDSRSRVITSFAAAKRVEYDPARVYVTDVFDPSSHLSSGVSHRELAPVSVDLLCCPKKHKGLSICVRVISKLVINGTGLVCLVEDRAGQAIMFRDDCPLPRPTRFYNQDYLQALYPVGSVMVIKEPYVRFAPIVSLPEIVVGVPVDVVLLPEAEGFEGSQLAHRTYNRALGDLNLDAPTRLSLLLNLGLSALYSGQPGSAWRAYEQIAQIVDSGAAILTDVQRAKYDKRRAEAAQRLDLNIDGTSKANHDLGTVETRTIPGKGLATVAARDLALGEPILVRKSLVVADHDLDMQWEYYNQPLIHAKQKSTGTWLTAAKALHELVDDPRKAADWATLHPRDDQVDVNASYTVNLPLDAQWKTSLAEIAAKIDKNANATSPTDGYERPGANCLGATRFSVAVDAGYSRLNHSCVPNTRTECWGPSMYVVTTKETRKGEELFTIYIPTGLNLDHRQLALQTGWGFNTLDDGLAKSGSVVALIKLVKDVDATYAPGRTLKPHLARVLDKLSQQASLPAAARYMYSKRCLQAAGFELAAEADLRAGKSLFKSTRNAAFEGNYIPAFTRAVRCLDELSDREVSPTERRATRRAHKLYNESKPDTPLPVVTEPAPWKQDDGSHAVPPKSPKTSSKSGTSTSAMLDEAFEQLFDLGRDGPVTTKGPTPAEARAYIDSIPESERLFDTHLVTMPNGMQMPVTMARDMMDEERKKTLAKVMVSFAPGGNGEAMMRKMEKK